MILNFKKPIVILTITLFSLLSVQAQNGFDLTSVNYTDLTNQQLQELFQEATSKGYDYNDILKAAKTQGLSSGEIFELEKRFSSANIPRASKNSNTPDKESRLRSTKSDNATLEYPNMKSDIFGFDVFKGNSLLSFQSNLNIPTPVGYILAPETNYLLIFTANRKLTIKLKLIQKEQ